MRRQWLILVSVLCVTWAAKYPSDEHAKQNAETEMEFDSSPPKSQLLEDAHEFDLTSQDHESENLEQDLSVQAAQQTDSIHNIFVQDGIAAETERSFVEEDQKIDNVQEYHTTEAVVQGHYLRGNERGSYIKQNIVQEYGITEAVTHSFQDDHMTNGTTQGNNVTVATIQETHIIENDEERHVQINGVLKTKDTNAQGNNLTESQNISRQENYTIESMGTVDQESHKSEFTTNVINDNMLTTERNNGATTATTRTSSTANIKEGMTTLIQEISETSSNSSFNENNGIDEETPPLTINISTISNEMSSGQNTHSEDTTISSEALEWPSPSTEDAQIGIITVSLNEDQNITNAFEDKENEIFNPILDNNFTTSSEIDLDSISQITTIVATSNSPNDGQISTEATVNLVSSNSSSSLDIHKIDKQEYTTITMNSSNDVTTIKEEVEGSTFSSFNYDKSTTRRPPALSNVSSTAGETHELHNSTTEETEELITHKTDLINNKTSEKTIITSEEGLKSPSTETIFPETLVTVLPETHTTEFIASSSQSSAETNNEKSISKQTCNSKYPCPDDEVCAFQVEGCVCVSNFNILGNLFHCPNLTEDTTEVNDNTSNTHHLEISINNATKLEHFDLKTFSIVKWRNLSSSQKTRKAVSITLSPAPEVIEWFQNYDWKFRKFVSSAVTMCILLISLNENDTHWVISPTQVIYISPTPVRDGQTLIVSFLVKNPWPASNNTFIDNKFVLGCLRDVQRDIETELGLTVNSLTGVYPGRLTEDCTSSFAGLPEESVKHLLVGTFVSLIIVIVVLIVLALKCRQARGRFHPGCALYRHPNVLTRSPGDGHNLATDEQCQLDEGRRRDPENGNVLGKDDSDAWVVPLEDMEAAKQDVRSENEEDSKV